MLTEVYKIYSKYYENFKYNQFCRVLAKWWPNVAQSLIKCWQFCLQSLRGLTSLKKLAKCWPTLKKKIDRILKLEKLLDFQPACSGVELAVELLQHLDHPARLELVRGGLGRGDAQRVRLLAVVGRQEPLHGPASTTAKFGRVANICHQKVTKSSSKVGECKLLST